MLQSISLRLIVFGVDQREDAQAPVPRKCHIPSWSKATMRLIYGPQCPRAL